MKKFTKLMCGVLSLGFALTGCATVSSIKNENQEIIYNGNAAVAVGEQLYFSNAFADYTVFEDTSDYKAAAKYSYISRLNTSIELAAESGDYSPAKVEKFNSDVSGHLKAFTFVLGNYIYYVTPNKEEAVSEEGVSGHYFAHSTFYRAKLNGSGKSKIYSTTGEVSNLEVLKFDGKYYMVMLAGDKLVRIQIGNSVKSAEVLAEEVKSIAIPETYQENNNATSLKWNGKIYFVTDRDGDENITGSVVKSISVDAKKGEETQVYSSIGKTITLSGREKDVVFYTLAESGKQTEVFKFDTNAVNGQVVLGKAEDRVMATDSISELNLIASSSRELGYSFISANESLMVMTKEGKLKTVSLTCGEKTVSGYKVLATKDRTLYLSTTEIIYSVDLSDAFSTEAQTISIECREIVKMEDGTISDNAIGALDGEYVYFYAKLQKIETEEEDKDDETEEEEEDNNLYMYRAKVGKSGEDNYELLSKTVIKSRHSVEKE
ncbi:MAG: hypothetical protein J6J24_05295 [Clostridia bacterium]|nr:hypothetical protein [Clostridia bacterium]